jgi:hypothetical protein
MNRFARRLSAAVVTTVTLLWVTAASASAVRVPLDQDVAPYSTGVAANLTPAAATSTSTSSATQWLLGVVLVAVVAGLAYVGRGTAHRHQGTLSAH